MKKALLGMVMAAVALLIASSAMTQANIEGAKDAAAPAEETVAIEPSAPRLIASISPGDGMTDVEPDTVVMVEFSVEMDDLCFTNGSIVVESQGARVDGKISYDERMRIAIFTPAKPFDAGTTYTITISADVKDVFGREIGKAASFSFTTRAPGALAIIDNGPSDGGGRKTDFAEGGEQTDEESTPTNFA